MRTVAFCEIDPYCQEVLTKHWPFAEVHGDITKRGFVRGEADVITAGFPCQDISFAGDGAGLAGARSGLYRHVIRALRLVRPRFAVLENVAALLSRGLDTVLGDMAEVGYDAEWHCIPASAVGAPHRRDRIWIIADAGGEQYEGRRPPFSGSLAAQLLEGYSNPTGERCGEAGQLRHGEPPEWSASVCQDVADAARELRDGSGSVAEQGGRTELANGSSALADADRDDVQGLFASSADQEERSGPIQRQVGSCGDGLGWWSVEPDVGRVAHGVPARVDRLRALGNSVVPQIPEIIGRAIMSSR